LAQAQKLDRILIKAQVLGLILALALVPTLVLARDLTLAGARGSMLQVASLHIRHLSLQIGHLLLQSS